MRRLLMIMIALCCFQITQAQQRECASQEVHERLLKENPAYAQRQAQIEALTADFMKNPAMQRQANGQIIIPCIVHVVYGNSQENISDAQIQSQIDRLNKDYSATNSDYNNVPSTFTNVRSGDTDIRFELIEIKRFSNSRATWGTNDAVKSAYPPIEPARILNMWVADIGGGILGYAQFPGGSPSTDGVVMSPQYFGDATVSGGGSFYLSAPFNRGRTATHEVGHWLNLRHIWGDGNCSQDDFVNDTPVAGNPNYGCPSAGTNSCSGGLSDMFMNYMDYVDDACMFMFSAGQDARMQATFSSNGGRSGFLLDPVYTPGGGSGGNTCNDTEVTFALTTDQYGSETSWTIKQGNTTVASGSGYGANQSYTETACLPDGDYVFTINDSYGDGICCQYGNGSYSLKNGSTTLASGSTFTNSESTNFTIGSTGPAPCNTPTGLSSSNITQTSFTLSWAAVSGAASYTVNVNGTTLSSTTNSLNVTGATAGTTYTCSVRTNCVSNASNFSSNISVTTSQSTALSCTSTISSFPYSESFESGLGAWTQGTGDDLNWTRDSNGTPSGSTGPSSATQGNFYMYVEASSPNFPSKVTYLDGPCFNLSSASVANFTFDYHMYGAAMGSLVLQAQTSAGSWTNLWSKSGNQGNAWASATVDMSAYLGQTVKVRFVGTTGSNYTSDMAIDNVKLSTTSGGGGGGTTAVNVKITFDNYPEETSWQIKSGSTVVASGGTYGSQADGSTINVPVNLAAGCYDFVITDAYGDGICCSYGNGSYTLTAGTTVLASGSSFASSQTTNFCVGSGARTAGGTSITEGLAPAGFNTYPNPVSSKLNISTGKMEASQYTITSTEGRVWMRGSIAKGESSVDVSSLAIGMYILTVNDGENMIVRRIVKK